MSYETKKYSAVEGLTIAEIAFIQNLAAEADNDSANVALTADLWVEATPTGTINGTNGTFTLPEDASEVIVFADGVWVVESSYTFTPGTDSIVFTSGLQPFSSIRVLYKPA